MPSSKSSYLTVDGRTIEAPAGMSVAGAMLANDVMTFTRSVKYHRARGPFCLSGDCGSCLVRIDGRPSVRACVTPADSGMVIERQNAFPSVDVDILAAADLVFARGMDHHTLGARHVPRLINAAMQKVVRAVAGVGRIPDEALALRPADLPAPRARRVDVVIVGAGPAGLGCAETLLDSGYRVLIVEAKPHAGGSLWAAPEGGTARAAIAQLAPRLDLQLRATAIGYFPEDRAIDPGPLGVLAVATPTGLLKVSARATVYATGSYDQNLLFGDNDRPGIVAARGLARLITQEDFIPRGTICIAGDYSHALAQLCVARGIEHVRLPPGAKLVRAHGRTRITAIEYEHKGLVTKQACDWLAIAARPAPASDLYRQHGGHVAFDDARGGFGAVADSDGTTSVAGMFACGDVCGYRTPLEASVAGKRTAASVAKYLEIA